MTREDIQQYWKYTPEMFDKHYQKGDGILSGFVRRFLYERFLKIVELLEVKEGDILSVDVGVKKSGYFGDAATTIPIGLVSEDTMKLLKVTEESLYAGIQKAVHKNHVSDISKTIQEHVEKNGFSVVRDFVGHGVGKKLHEEPPIPNYKTPGRGPRLLSGMTLAIATLASCGF